MYVYNRDILAMSDGLYRDEKTEERVRTHTYINGTHIHVCNLYKANVI